MDVLRNNIITRRLARRRIARIAIAALLANELERGDLQQRVLACLEEHRADPVLEEAVVEELRRFRRRADRGHKRAALTNPEDPGIGGFFDTVKEADRCAKRLLPAHQPTLTR